MDELKVREAFEAWCRHYGYIYPTNRSDPNNRYVNGDMQQLWTAWRGAVQWLAS